MGTVTVVVNEKFMLNKVDITKNYYIYVDDLYQEEIINMAPITLQKIPVGVTNFKAYNYKILEDVINPKEKREIPTVSYDCSGMISKDIFAGINPVEIPVYCFPWPIFKGNF